jgi:hypothetical protein
MATRRFRKSRRSRKSRRGGVLGIPFLKTTQDNISNCERYWSSDNNHPAGRCKKSALELNYPGLIKKRMGHVVTNKKGVVQENW